MITLGYALSSEEWGPDDLVAHARRAERAGFAFAMISDHFHPWVDRQGHSPFVWAVLGALAQATERLTLGTAVTCPTIRIHPAIIAQAAATCAALLPGRFWLGVGSGEALNEHVLGDRWPPPRTRRAMLEEAIRVIRLLWQGGSQTFRGRYYTVESARVYTLPDTPPPILVAAGGPRAAELAGRLGDGIIVGGPDRVLLQHFEAAGGRPGPRVGSFKACYARDAAEARAVARDVWPNAAMPGQLTLDLPTPRHYEQLAALVTEEQVAREVICGPDPAPHLALIRRYAEAGYTHVYVHQVGPDQEGFFRLYEREVLPELGARRWSGARACSSGRVILEPE